jgi:hypothetical protein
MMQFVKSHSYSTTIDVTAPDAKLLAEACELALEHKVNIEQENDYQKLELFQALFQVIAVMGTMQYAFPLNHLEGLRDTLADLELESFLDRPELNGEAPAVEP